VPDGGTHGIEIVREHVTLDHLRVLADGLFEFDSMINVRPRVGNRSRFVEDESKRGLIVDIVDRLVRG
jgi:hypothetical protein